MCGRFVLHTPADEIRDVFGAELSSSNVVGPLDWEADYNITPAQTIPVVANNGEGERTLVPMRWGLHPSWQKTGPGSRPLFNARSETVAEKPSFRSAFRRRRALVPCNGFYEWTRKEDENGDVEKLPYFIFDTERPLFAFAAIWEIWTDPEQDDARPLLSTATLTMPAEGKMAELHHRQPVRLDAEHWPDWLSAEMDADTLLQAAIPSDSLSYYRVGKAVNSGRASGAELMEKLGS